MPDYVLANWYYFLCFVTAAGMVFYLSKIYTRVKDTENEPADEESRKMYFETFKMMVTAAGLAIPVIGATLISSQVKSNFGMLKWAALCLVCSVIFSMILLLDMSRRYERQRAETFKAQPDAAKKAAAEMASKISPKSGEPDYEAGLEVALKFCRSKTQVPGLKKNDLGWLVVWAWFSSVGFIWGLLSVVWFVVAFVPHP
jgi:uncharacterized membrane protein